LRATHTQEEFVPFWENPNIHGYQEYFQRFESFQRLTTALGLTPLIGDATYGLRRFLAVVGPNPDRASRCAACFRLRLTATAARARQEHFAAFSTTLLISPYQDHSLLVQIGQEVSAAAGVPFLAQDLRPAFRETYAVARREGLYKQKYCGCLFSEEERFTARPPRPSPA
jgi:predicted adenine nucleotide alpha hydrolase (AANH) superfamily ATPase